MSIREKMEARCKAIADEREALAQEYEEIASALQVMDRFQDDEISIIPWRGRKQDPGAAGKAVAVASGQPGNTVVTKSITKDDLDQTEQAYLNILFLAVPDNLSALVLFEKGPDITSKQFNAAVLRMAQLGLIELTEDRKAWQITDKGHEVGTTLDIEKVA